MLLILDNLLSIPSTIYMKYSILGLVVPIGRLRYVNIKISTPQPKPSLRLITILA
jgi:hypothetical protein